MHVYTVFRVSLSSFSFLRVCVCTSLFVCIHLSFRAAIDTSDLTRVWLYGGNMSDSNAFIWSELGDAIVDSSMALFPLTATSTSLLSFASQVQTDQTANGIVTWNAACPIGWTGDGALIQCSGQAYMHSACIHCLW